MPSDGCLLATLPSNPNRFFPGWGGLEEPSVSEHLHPRPLPTAGCVVGLLWGSLKRSILSWGNSGTLTRIQGQGFWSRLPAKSSWTIWTVSPLVPGDEQSPVPSPRLEWGSYVCACTRVCRYSTLYNCRVPSVHWHALSSLPTLLDAAHWAR